MSEAGDARFWNRAARNYAARPVDDPAAYERTLDRTRALLRPGDRVIELGCGTGSTALSLAGAAGAYLATDISPEMIAIAREKHAAAPVAGLEFRVATAASLAGEAGAANAVLAFNVLHLARGAEAELRRIRDLLVEGGLFISKTPCLGDMNPLIRLAVIPALRAIGKAPFVRSFRAADLAGLIAAAGFDILAEERHAERDGRPFIVARRR